MGRILTLIYGVATYFIFFGAFLYSIGFVGKLIVPKNIDSGQEGALGTSIVINLVLLSVFAVQHSVMARPGFKKVWTRIIPKSIERSTYVLLSSLALCLIFAYWQAMPGIIWDASGTPVGMALQVIFWAGWLIVLASTFMIDHFDLFGLRQVYSHFKTTVAKSGSFQKNYFYKLVRHPIMTGFIISFWAAPVMTAGHLLFAIVTTAYVYIAVKHFEEKDLINEIGEDYIDYQKEVGILIPGIGKKR